MMSSTGHIAISVGSQPAGRILGCTRSLVQTAIRLPTRRRHRWQWPHVLFASLLMACAAAVLVAAGGSLSSSIPAVAAFSFPFQPTTVFDFLLPTGPGPVAMALHPDGSKLYVANEQDQTVAMLDTTSYEVRASGSLPYAPYSVGVTPDGGQLFITAGLNLLALDPTSLSITETITPEQGRPVVMAFSPEGSKVYVANGGSDFGGAGHTVSVIDSASHAVLKTIDVGESPLGIVISRDGRRLAVANTGDLKGDPTFGIPPAPGSTVSLIDTDTDEVVTTVTVGSGPTLMAMSADASRLFVVNSVDGTVSVVRLPEGDILATLPVGAEPAGLALSGRRNVLYVASRGDGTITVIDTRQAAISGRVALGAGTTALALGTDDSRLYALQPEQRRVAVVALEELAQVGEIPVGDEPVAVALQSDRQQGYALGKASADVTVFDSATLEVRAISALALRPFAVALSPDGSRLYVTNAGHNSVAAVDARMGTVTATPRVGSQPLAVAFSPDGSRAYVANAADDSVSVLDVGTDRVVATYRDLTVTRPVDVSVSADAARLMVLGASALAVLDASTGGVLAHVDLDPFYIPSALAASLNGKVFIALTCAIFGFCDQAQVMIVRVDIDTGGSQQVLQLAAVEAIVDLAVAPDGSLLASTHEDLLVIDPGAGAVLTTVESHVGDYLALTPAGEVFMSYTEIFSMPPGALVAVDLSAGAVRYSRELTSRASGIAASPDGARVYLVRTDDAALSVVDGPSGDTLVDIPLPQVQRPR